MALAYDHDDCGNRTQMTEATGDVTTYAYDALYELTGQTKRNSGDVVQYSYSYTYDDIGNSKSGELFFMWCSNAPGYWAYDLKTKRIRPLTLEEALGRVLSHPDRPAGEPGHLQLR